MPEITTVSSRRIGTIVLDAVVEETHQSDLDVTENPIESGAQVADHAVLLPQVITVAGVVVDYVPKDGPAVGRGDTLSNEWSEQASALVDRVGLPSDLETFTPQTLAIAKAQLSSYVSIAAQLQRQAKAAARPLAPWLPDYSASAAIDNSQGDDARLQQFNGSLSAMQRSGQPVEVQTGMDLYKDMLLVSKAIRQTKDGSAEVVLTLRQIVIVETKRVGGIALPAPKKGRTSSQGAAKSRQGQSPPKEADEERRRSLLLRVGDLIH